jgi:hypothetical protein
LAFSLVNFAGCSRSIGWSCTIGCDLSSTVGPCLAC